VVLESFQFMDSGQGRSDDGTQAARPRAASSAPAASSDAPPPEEDDVPF